MLPIEKMILIYIYGLFDPGNPEVILYPGATANPKTRLVQHLSTFEIPRKPWLIELIRRKTYPKMKILEVTNPEDAKTIEDAYIAKYAPNQQKSNYKSRYIKQSSIIYHPGDIISLDLKTQIRIQNRIDSRIPKLFY